MAHVIFYEKPGCGGNERQKALLRAAGHDLEVRDLLSWPWTPATLLPFLSGAPVADWFNRTSPRVKAREVIPEATSAGEALALLLADPGLIRRPLMQVGQRREVGFLSAVVEAWIGLEPLEPAAPAGCGPLEGCCGGGGHCGSRATGGDGAVVQLRR